MAFDAQAEILRAVTAALHSKKLYPAGHPSIAAPSRRTYQLITDYLKGKPKLTICFVDDALVFDDVPVAGGEENYPDIIEQMKKKRIEAILFERGTSEKEIFSLFDVISQEKELSDTELQKELGSRGITHITLKTLPIGKRNFVEVYNDAIKVVKNVMDDVRAGKIPDPTSINNIADEMTDLVLSDTNAMIGLTMIKNYDDYLYNHSVNVSILSVAMGKFLGLGKEELHKLGVASLLHDVGKTGVSEGIIKKPGGLSFDEWEKVKEHPVLGSKIAERMKGIDNIISRIIIEHHVRFDRSGYPHVDNPLHPLSLIVGIADAYDALTTLRVYQKPYQPVEAVKILRGLSGKHFDPKTVNAFENMVGIYPVGTMVRLSTNEVGIVTKVTQGSGAQPIVKILYDSNGDMLANPLEIDLSQKGETIVKIIGPADPLARNMNLGEFFTKEVGAASQ